MDFEKIDSNDPARPSPGLGSLTQAARSKQLKTARGLLFFVGGWLIFSLLINWLTLDYQLRDVARKEGIPEARLPELKEAVMPGMYVFTAIYLGLSVLYIVFGAVVHKHPVPITITALVVFIAMMVIYAVIDPVNILRGIILKIIVIVGLAKAIQSALAYQRELDTYPVDAIPAEEEAPKRDPDW